MQVPPVRPVNTYNMLKLSKALYHVTGDKKYMDYFERTYTNAILPSQNPETGTTMYFQPMAPGYNKVFNRPFDEFWCCTGTGWRTSLSWVTIFTS